jgi:hypothetical protein
MKNADKNLLAIISIMTTLIYFTSCSPGNEKNPSQVMRMDSMRNDSMLLSQNCCNGVHPPPEVGLTLMDEHMADSLYRLYDPRKDSLIRGTFMTAEWTLSLLCLEPDTIFTRLSIKEGTTSEVTAQFVVKNKTSVAIYTPTTGVPICPTICYPPE